MNNAWNNPRYARSRRLIERLLNVLDRELAETPTTERPTMAVAAAGALCGRSAALLAQAAGEERPKDGPTEAQLANLFALIVQALRVTRGEGGSHGLDVGTGPSDSGRAH